MKSGKNLILINKYIRHTNKSNFVENTPKGRIRMAENFLSSNDIRTKFSRAMSAMYREEIPQYGQLLYAVAGTNIDKLLEKWGETIKINNEHIYDEFLQLKKINEQDFIADPEQMNRKLDNLKEPIENLKNPELKKALLNFKRTTEEKHGAIRIGTEEELQAIADIFAIMGMQPVGYYNLAPEGLPVHSTAFRPVNQEALEENPFRVFTSFLRQDQLSANAKKIAEPVLNTRKDPNNPFKNSASNVMHYIKLFKENNGLNKNEAQQFVDEALKIFRWSEGKNQPRKSHLNTAEYKQLLAESGLLADAVGVGINMNHLTPSSADIDASHQKMKDLGLTTIPAIQGPPSSCPVLLRQTSFEAVQSPVEFTDGTSGHRARFGEIEQRFVALTPEGRKLYDLLLSETHKITTVLNSDGKIDRAKSKEKHPDYVKILNEVFTNGFCDNDGRKIPAIPASMEEMRKQGLAYFQYSRADKNAQLPEFSGNYKNKLQSLIDAGIVIAEPIIYNDFLPVSATGIFKSNLVEGGESEVKAPVDKQEELEKSMGRKILDPFAIYAADEAKSISAVFDELKITLQKEDRHELDVLIKADPRQKFIQARAL
jgi:uncharacterized glyoxalase superfamily metalloenzyme YdcJ